MFWLAWALLIVGGIPIWESNKACEIAGMAQEHQRKFPSKDENDRVKADLYVQELYSKASWSHIFKGMIQNLHWILLFILLPPVVFYGLIRGLLSLGKWVYRGFHAA